MIFGENIPQSVIRMEELRGFCYRNKGFKLTNQSKSLIRSHSFKENYPFSHSNYEIFDSSQFDLYPILESQWKWKLKLNLNEYLSFTDNAILK